MNLAVDRKYPSAALFDGNFAAMFYLSRSIPGRWRWSFDRLEDGARVLHGNALWFGWSIAWGGAS